MIENEHYPPVRWSSESTALTKVLTAIAAALVLGTLWLLLAGTEVAAWVIGGPVVALALAMVLVLPPSYPAVVRPGAAVRLVAMFLFDSFRGALDVGARCIAPQSRIRPQIVEWQMSLRSSFARLVFVHAISLIPGTLTARVSGANLLIHVLDVQGPWRVGLVALEARIAAAFEPGAEESS